MIQKNIHRLENIFIAPTKCLRFSKKTRGLNKCLWVLKIICMVHKNICMGFIKCSQVQKEIVRFLKYSRRPDKIDVLKNIHGLKTYTSTWFKKIHALKKYFHQFQ